MGPQSRAQPKNGTKAVFKIGPKSRPQNAIPGRQLCRKTQRRFSRHNLQSVVCSAILFNCLQQTKNFNQRRNRNLGRQIRSNKEHVYVYRPNIVKTWPPFRRYTVQFHAWENQQHACYSTITSYVTRGDTKQVGFHPFLTISSWFIAHQTGPSHALRSILRWAAARPRADPGHRLGRMLRPELGEHLGRLVVPQFVKSCCKFNIK